MKKAKVVILLSILLVAYGGTAAIPLAAPISESVDDPIYLPLVLKDWRPYEFMYEQGSMQVAPNCGVVYIAGVVLDHDGSPMDGITVRLQFFDYTVYVLTGPDGRWGFTPLPPGPYHTPVPFYVQLVDSQSDPTPRSDALAISFIDCVVAGQFTNITFRRQY